MVKKLIKHEFVYYLRTLLIFLPIVIVMGLVTCITGFFKSDSVVYILVLTSSVGMLYFASIICIVLTMILSVVRFYKNLYSQEGYLTFTLPINNHQHLLVKLLVSISCQIISILTVIIAWLIAGITYSEVWNVINEIFAEIGEALKLIDSVHMVFYVIEIIILLCLSILYSHLLYFCCITLGQTARKNRIFTAVGYYFAYYMITQVVMTVFMIILTTLGIAGALDGIGRYIANNPYSTAHIFFIFCILFISGLNYLFYHLTINVMNNKLNLE